MASNKLVKKFLIGILIIFIGVFVFTRKERTDTQEDFLFLCDKIIRHFPFESNLEVENFKKIRDDHIEDFKDEMSEEDFVNKINNLLMDLDSPHTNLMDRENSYMIINLYERLVEEEPLFDVQFDYILDEFRENDVREKYKDYIEKNEEDNIFTNLNDTKNYIYFTIADKKLGYIRINSLWHDNIDNDKKLIKESFENFSDFDAIVVDLRNNYGGDSQYFSDLFFPLLLSKDEKVEFYELIKRETKNRKNLIPYKKIKDDSMLQKAIERQLGDNAKYVLENYEFYNKEITSVKIEPQSIKFKGNIYFLVNENTNSSASYFAAFAQANKIGTLIGMPTANESFGSDPMYYILPKSKLLLRICDQLIISPDIDFNLNGKRTRGAIVPDILVDSYISNNVDVGELKKDPCIMEILKLENIK